MLLQRYYFWLVPARITNPRQQGEYQNIDNETLKRMKELEKLSKED
jgi:hypothetical protein